MTCRCGKDHSGVEPLDVNSVMDRMVQELADEIDREMIAELLALSNSDMGLISSSPLNVSDDKGIIQSQSFTRKPHHETDQA